MQITRVYNNSLGDIIRIDTITIDVKPPTYKDLRIGNDPGIQMKVGPQKIKTEIVTSSSSISGSLSGRVVDDIEIKGDFDDYDDSSPHGMTWATKTLGNDQVIRYNMSSLPVVGDTV